MHPAYGCKCVPKSEIRELYPDWATDEDIIESIEKGFAEATEQ